MTDRYFCGAALMWSETSCGDTSQCSSKVRNLRAAAFALQTGCGEPENRRGDTESHLLTGSDQNGTEVSWPVAGAPCFLILRTCVSKAWRTFRSHFADASSMVSGRSICSYIARQ